mmetsp:Transcript_23355/g.55663  ORF Transcript_23355/g.55663 Transcript_23355/m.55663 type:complete len:216 (+) Transcript_23355:773-1420(+)
MDAPGRRLAPCTTASRRSGTGRTDHVPLPLRGSRIQPPPLAFGQKERTTLTGEFQAQRCGSNLKAGARPGWTVPVECTGVRTGSRSRGRHLDPPPWLYPVPPFLWLSVWTFLTLRLLLSNWTRKTRTAFPSSPTSYTTALSPKLGRGGRQWCRWTRPPKCPLLSGASRRKRLCTCEYRTPARRTRESSSSSASPLRGVGGRVLSCPRGSHQQQVW